MAIKNVYGFTDDGKKVKIGEYLEVFPVGGTIFYIDETSDAAYKFYDANMVELSSVAVGDSPAYYEVITEDSNGKDKYYIYNPTNGVVDSKAWGYYNIKTGATSQAIGDGKTNTETILAIEDTSQYASDSIFTWLKSQRENKLGGCDDWFIGSKNEMEQLRLFVVANAGTGDIVDFFTDKEVWNSSENDTSLAYAWVFSSSYYRNKSNKIHCCCVRAF